MDKIKIIHEPTEEKPFLIIYKPKGIPSAPLTENDSNCALFQAINLFPELKKVKGRKEIEYGLLHRIDTPTDGLLLIAATQNFYDFLNIEQSNGRFFKYYSALCSVNPSNGKDLEGFPELTALLNKKGKTNVSSYFRFYGPGNKEVRPVTKASGKAALKKIGKLKEYSTEIQIKQQIEDKAVVECKISEGYRHQVRCHLAWVGLPIEGDTLYNFNKKNCPEKDSFDLQFTATKIEFEYPKGDLNSYEITFTWT